MTEEHYETGRRQMRDGDWQGAYASFNQYLEVGHWAVKRSAAMRHLGTISQVLDPDNAETWFLNAVLEATDRRDPWLALAQHYHDQGEWTDCLLAASRTLMITDRPLDFDSEPYVWGSRAYDLAAIAAHKLGLHDWAKTFGTAAAEASPDDERLKTNLFFYEAAVPVA